MIVILQTYTFLRIWNVWKIYPATFSFIKSKNSFAIVFGTRNDWLLVDLTFNFVYQYNHKYGFDSWSVFKIQSSCFSMHKEDKYGSKICVSSSYFFTFYNKKIIILLLCTCIWFLSGSGYHWQDATCTKFLLNTYVWNMNVWPGLI